jgi:hypothetical protein
MLTELAPLTFHDRVEVPSALRLLLNCMIAGCIPTGGIDTELTVVVADLATVPVELVALMV